MSTNKAATLNRFLAWLQKKLKFNLLVNDLVQI